MAECLEFSSHNCESYVYSIFRIMMAEDSLFKRQGQIITAGVVVVVEEETMEEEGEMVVATGEEVAEEIVKIMGVGIEAMEEEEEDEAEGTAMVTGIATKVKCIFVNFEFIPTVEIRQWHIKLDKFTLNLMFIVSFACLNK